MNSFAALQSLAEIAPSYLDLRRKHPEVPARQVHAYLRFGEGERFEHFICPGHEWAYTGSAYGGDDESYFGRGPMLLQLLRRRR